MSCKRRPGRGAAVTAALSGAAKMAALTMLAWGCDAPIDVDETRGLRLSSVLGESSTEGFRVADRVVPIVFPQDHGAHADFRTEWWYLTASMVAANGDEYGLQFTLFRQALTPGLAPSSPRTDADDWRSAQVYLAHLAVTDVTRNRHLSAERLARGHRRLAGVRAQPFAAWIEGWRLESSGEALYPMRLNGATAGFRVDLTLQSSRSPVLQGDHGLSFKGPTNASYYYSMPRVAMTGSIWIDGRAVSVQGRGWLDREWSTSVLAQEYAGWDWFALQFDDGRDVMVFQLRRRDGRADDFDQGVLVDASGNERALGADDFALIVEREWLDERQTRWPVRWRLDLDGDTFTIEAAIDDQVMDTSVRYWEGLVRVSSSDGRDLGRGYMELTGYR